MLIWLHGQGCPWNSKTCKAAAERGNMEVLKWLHSQGCPWDEETCIAAAELGHLEMLKWAEDHGCPDPFMGEAIWSRHEL